MGAVDMAPAPLGARAGAWAIDLLITVPAPVALYVAVGVLVFDDDVPLAVALVLVVAVLAFHLLYAPLLQARSGASAGQTLGKRLLGIRVVAPSGRLTLGRALRRELVGRSLLGLVPLYTAVDLLWPLGDERRRAVHDHLAQTMVVPADLHY